MATIGTVTYPTSTTWAVTVYPDQDSQTFTVSDGTDSVPVTVTGPVADTTYPSDAEWSVLIPASEAPGTFEAVASTGETASVVVEIGSSGDISLGATAAMAFNAAVQPPHFGAIDLGATTGMAFNANHGISRGTQVIKPGGFLWSGTRAVGTNVTVTKVGP